MKIVLVNPDIPWNAGNIGRTCVATGTELCFVGKMGFNLSDKEIRRSGLDYWQFLKHSVHADFEAFLATLPEGAKLHLFTTRGTKTYWEDSFCEDSCLVFGSETAGLPDWMYEKYADRLVKIPMWSERMRSLNLSTSAGVALYEALRQVRGLSPHQAG
jgi:tRNA (cytidine/uridine-2'-O-)-methyltransferase